MSGRRIDDHKFWAGGPSKESPMPMHSKMKQEHSAVGEHMGEYEDTTEKIHSQQAMAISKAKSHNRKPLHRN